MSVTAEIIPVISLEVTPLEAEPWQEIYESMRNDPVPGEAVREVIKRINGGMSPATEAMLGEMVDSWQVATKKALGMAAEGYPYNPEGIHTPKTLEQLKRLRAVTSDGSVIWAMQPGLMIDTIRSSVIRLVSGRYMANWLSMASSSNLGGTHPDVEVADIFTSREIGSNNCAAYTPWTGERMAKEMLVEKTPGNHDKVVIFANSGGEAATIAIEAAMKAGERLAEREHGVVIACEQAYHGNQGLAGLATDHGVRQKYGKILNGPIHILPFPHDPESAEKFLHGYPIAGQNRIPGYLELVKADKLNGVIWEQTQGDGGFVTLDNEVAKTVIKTNEQIGALTIWDEIQGGIGRAGTLWMIEALEPDLLESPNNVVVTAKALGNGYPVSAVVLPKHLDAFQPPEALSTMMAEPRGLVRLMTVLEIVDDTQFLEAVQLKGQFLQHIIENGRGNHLRGFRGRGLMCGAEITNPDGSSAVTPMVIYLAYRGILTNAVGRSTLRTHPRLTEEPEIIHAVGQAIVEGGKLMDSGEMPELVYEMVKYGKSGLDEMAK